jgi:chemotaxis family two-component system response regulator Rcp1
MRTRLLPSQPIPVANSFGDFHRDPRREERHTLEKAPMTRVLIVEDNPYDSMQAKEFIKEAGVSADVVEVPDGEKALDILEKARQGRLKGFDLVLLDLNLPRKGGFEVLEHLKDRKGKPFVAVLSGSCALEDRMKAETKGADAYLVKPVGASEIDAIVNCLRDIFRELRENPSHLTI